MIQIARHAAAILVCVKLHNKPDWRSFVGWWWGGERLELWVGANEGEVFGSQTLEVFWTNMLGVLYVGWEVLLRCKTGLLILTDARDEVFLRKPHNDFSHANNKSDVYKKLSKSKCHFVLR